jgi:hypothetical protein
MAYDLQLFTNNAISLLASPISASATTLTVMSGHGFLFPQPTGPNQYFLITLEDQAATTREIIRVNGRTGDTFTGIQRGQEGTPAVAWSASIGADTLVDHRVTAETMRLAMLLPETTAAVASTIDIQLNGVTVGVPASTLNFTGAGVSVTGAGTTKTINIPGGSGSAWIYGENTGPTLIDPGHNDVISSVSYSDNNRGFKFIVTILMPSNGRSESFEVMANIDGNISLLTEVANWTRYARIGYNFLGSLGIDLVQPSNQLQLKWLNSEAATVRVMCVRIQHAP